MNLGAEAAVSCIFRNGWRFQHSCFLVNFAKFSQKILTEYLQVTAPSKGSDNVSFFKDSSKILIVNIYTN